MRRNASGGTARIRTSGGSPRTTSKESAVYQMLVADELGKRDDLCIIIRTNDAIDQNLQIGMPVSDLPEQAHRFQRLLIVPWDAANAIMGVFKTIYR